MLRLVIPAWGRLSGALLRAGLVDEVNIELCPALIGGRVWLRYQVVGGWHPGKESIRAGQ